jgi:endonuclease/exonuclease/phosphatase family metal-dependent hydrolase
VKKAVGFVTAAVVAAGLVVLPQVGRAGSVSAQALVPDTAGDSAITLELTPLAGAAPAVTQRVQPGEPVAFRSLPAGRYAVAITGLGPDLDPSGLECSPVDAVGIVDEYSGVAVVDVAAGRDISCTFEAVPRGRIVVSATTQPAESTRRTQFAASWTTPFRLPDGASLTSTPLEPGTYSVAAAAPRGWTASDPVCDDGSHPDAIGLDPGETVTCTFVTTQGGRIVLEHDAAPTGQPAIFGFRPSWGERLLLDARQTVTSVPLAPGTYSVARGRPPGWDLGRARCTGGQSPTRIRLGAGETVTCRFTSEQRGRIVVVARTDSSADASFAYRTTWGDPFELAGDGTRTSRLLSPGTYALRDRVPAGWVQGAASCSDGSTLRAIRLQPGETVTCTLDYGQPRFTVASFNVLGHSHTEPGGHSPELAPGPARMETQMGLLRGLGVDVVGPQEFQSPQMDAFVRLSGGEYALYPSPQTAQQNKQNAVAWRTSVFDLVEARSVMIPYFNGNLVPMPLVKLRHRSTGLDVWVMSVHNAASIRKLGDQTRWRDAAMSQQIALTNELVADGTPFIMTGDMNEREKYFCAFTANGRMAAAAGGSVGSPCQPPPASIARIDWIFGSRDIAFSDYRLVDDATVNRTSDHPLVLAEAVLSE